MPLSGFIRTPGNVRHEVKLAGPDTVKDLYRKAADAAAAEEGTFLLSYEGEVLGEEHEGEEMQQLGVEEGCELEMQYIDGANTMCVRVWQLLMRRPEILQRVQENPNLVLVVDASGTSCLDLPSERFPLPPALRHLRVTSRASVTSIGDSFLSNSRLVSVDLAELHHVRSVGDRFLSGSGSLTTLHLPSSFTTNIGDDFLKDCRDLPSVGLSTLQNVTRVGRCFLSGCESLQVVDASHLQRLMCLKDGFLSGCCSLTSVDLSPNLAEIGSGFLEDCGALVDVNCLKNLREVMFVGRCFMRGCRSVRSVDVSQMRHLLHVAERFLDNCTSLTSVDLPPNVRGISNCFLKDCPALMCVNLNSLQNVASSLPDEFLSGCSAVRTVDLSGLRHVRWIGESFLENCTSLTSVHLPPDLMGVGSSFLRNCSALVGVDLSPLQGVADVSAHFMSGCVSLHAVDATPLKGVTSFGDSVLRGCSSLRTLDICGLLHVEKVGSYVLYDTPSLATIDLTHIRSSVKVVGKEFLGNSGVPPHERKMSMLQEGRGWWAENNKRCLETLKLIWCTRDGRLRYFWFLSALLLMFQAFVLVAYLMVTHS
eukprot:TRINITY_DN6306_c0_g1_i2.p1 TRINITY_DN6306_c0_g1~~TRINITY_DN6306_c0_g1_i2.p1  ORF type:complete len:593 (+),score=85.94 TRINITY_DN6306_c0_g1_i2:73-1851(+)